MTTKHRPRRSMLYMPGSNARALEKGRGLDADALILDLEDAVAPDAKQVARQQVVAAVREGGYGHRELLVRSNGLNTPWGYDDLVAAATSGADAVLLPKIDSADMVRQAESIIDAAGAPESMTIWCMMETPRGMLRAEEIADASPRLGGFVMGTSDLAKDLHARHTAMRLPMITSLGLCLLAARAAGIAGKLPLKAPKAAPASSRQVQPHSQQAAKRSTRRVKITAQATTSAMSTRPKYSSQSM